MHRPSNAAFGFIVGFALSFAALTFSGCAASQDNAERAAEVNAAIDRQSEAVSAAAVRQTEALDEAVRRGDPEAEAAARNALDEIRKAQQAIAKARDIAGTVVNPDGSTNTEALVGAASTAAFAVNPLLGLGVLIAGPVITGLIAERRRQKAIEDAASVVRSIDAAKASNPKLAEAFKESADVLRATQTADARRLVDVAQGKGAS
jgi:hypothetical protein